MQQVVLPSLWPRKKNTRGPGSADGEEGVPKEGLRDVREEARREVEEERRRDRERREREEGGGGGGGTMVDASAFEEGLRWRNRTYEDMPGSMPDMLVN